MRLPILTLVFFLTAIANLKADSLNVSIDKSGQSSLDQYHLVELVLAAGGILIGVLIARKQNQVGTITHFREKWLTELRSAYCESIAIHEAICQRLKSLPKESNKRDPKADPDWHKLHFQTTKIKLLLHHNPTSDDWKHPVFWGMFMDYTEQSFNKYSGRSITEEEKESLETFRNEVEVVLLDILKDEWEKLKLLEKRKWFKGKPN